jgi:hypothetical protein
LKEFLAGLSLHAAADILQTLTGALAADCGAVRPTLD